MKTSLTSQTKGAGKTTLIQLARQTDWLGLLFLSAMLLTVTWSIERAEWVSPLPSLSLIVLAALATGFVLLQIRILSPLWYFVGILLGGVTVLWQTTSMLPAKSGWIEAIREIITRVAIWLEIAQKGGISNDPLPFVLTLVALTWLLGFFSGWLLARGHQGFWATIPSGTGILINLYYAPRQLAFIFILYLLASMLLVIRTNQVKWERRRQDDSWVNPRKGKFAYHLTIFGVCAVIVFSAWQMPVVNWAPNSEVWNKLELWKSVSREFERLFPMLASERATPMYTFGSTLPFRGPVNLSGKLVFQVVSDYPGYWRGNTYEVYTPQGWLSAPRTTSPLREPEPDATSENYRLRKMVTQTVQLAKSTDIFFAAGMPQDVDRPALAEIIQQPSFTIDLEDWRQDEALPAELRSWAAEARRKIRQSRQSPSIQELSASLPSQFAFAGAVRRGVRISSLQIKLAQSPTLDISSLRSPRPLSVSQSYTAVSSVSQASAQALRSAGEVYPEWIKRQFLQLPAELPARVRQLAKEVTQDADNPYDQAIAIETHLRSLSYRLDIKAPPTNSDAVDYFLFSSKTGYCDYFASAMAVMLRSVGVPSRIVAGYATGEFDSRGNAYVVRENDAHSWPEVFFPGYGWVEFEPTPSRNPIVHGKEQSEDDTTAVAAEFEDEDYYDEDLLGGGQNLRIKIALALLMAALGFGLAMGVTRYIRWRWLSKLGYEAQTYEKMCRLAAPAGLAPKPYQTPQEYARILFTALPASTGDINTIVESYVRTTYGGKRLVEEERLKLEQAWPKLRSKLWQRLIRRR